MSDSLPACGLYKTGVALPGHEDQVGVDTLVYFHNHSDQGPPMVLTPHDNQHNRWSFHERGWAADDPAFLESLIALKAEGLYVNAVHIHVGRDEILPPRTLLQLGYNRSGKSILFIGRFRDNSITFPTQGYSFESLDVQALLEPAGFVVPKPRAEDSLH